MKAIRLNRATPNWLSRTVLFLAMALVLAFAVRWLLPIYRVGYRSEMVMLGDFNGDHLRDLLASPKYAEFQAGRVPAPEILHEIERCLKQDLEVTLDLDHLGPPRDLTSLKNYLSRTQWQYYKSRTRTEQFEQLIRFAQHDRRYLRAVARTSRKHTDPGVENHNLPMTLLFREALRITGDKKAAVGLLDECIRIPFFWEASFRTS
jgi:hypothetical protein